MVKTRPPRSSWKLSKTSLPTKQSRDCGIDSGVVGTLHGNGLKSVRSSLKSSRTPQTDPLLSSIILAIRQDLNSPNSIKAAEMLAENDWAGICGLSADPSNYSTPEAYFSDVIPTWLKKCYELADPADAAKRDSATAQKWWEAEQACYRTNLRLKQFLPGCVQHTEVDLHVHRHLAGVRKIIESWIGYGPSEPELGFSPGSTVTERGALSTAAHKLHKSPSCTPHLEAAGFPGFIGTMWHHNMVDADLEPTRVRGEEYFTVPKKYNIGRPAAMQPTLNASCQVARGRELKRRLKRSTGTSLDDAGNLIRKPGWDLREAQAIHREVARVASLDRSFCTIDLSSASDMQARVLVQILLPTGWYKCLDALRCHTITKSPASLTADGLPGGDGAYWLEKFSAMGNGFTFEVETIIFAAIACYITRCHGYWGELGFDVFVYGDDIIVRDELYRECVAFLEFCGYSVNLQKSFHGAHNPFRESCGADFFNGVDVRGFFPEKSPTGPLEVVSLANQVRICADKAALIGINLNRTWFTALSHLPRQVRDVRGPLLLGDTVVYDPNPLMWRRRRRQVTQHCIRSDFSEYSEIVVVEEQCQILRDKGVVHSWDRFDPATVLACAVLGFGEGNYNKPGGISPRAPRRTYADRASQPDGFALHWATQEANPGIWVA